jgi:hypothetical protein
MDFSTLGQYLGFGSPTGGSAEHVGQMKQQYGLNSPVSDYNKQLLAQDADFMPSGSQAQMLANQEAEFADTSDFGQDFYNWASGFKDKAKENAGAMMQQQNQQAQQQMAKSQVVRQQQQPNQQPIMMPTGLNQSSAMQAIQSGMPQFAQNKMGLIGKAPDTNQLIQMMQGR